jgi:polyisoprenoid-binding protein YceI
MKNTFKLIATTLAVYGLALLLTQCKKDEGTKYSKLSGKVTLSDAAVASGAIVSISSEPNAAKIIGNTVADANGNYSFESIQNGTYYINARYEPSNNNNSLKSAGTVILTGAEAEVSLDGNKSVDIVLSGIASSGTGVISTADGWVNDNIHSKVEFEFPYDAVNAVFTGNFATNGVDEIEFDEQHPENTVIKAWVDLISVETGAASVPGQSGRDGIIGCISHTYKVDLDAADTIDAYSPSGELITNWPNDALEAYDLWGDASETSYEKQSAVVGATGVATLVAKDVTSYGTGYLATCDLTFAGVTKEVKLYFNYLDGYEAENRQGVLTKFVSIYGWFKFAPASDFEVTSPHFGENEITVKLSIQFTKALA